MRIKGLSVRIKLIEGVVICLLQDLSNMADVYAGKMDLFIIYLPIAQLKELYRIIRQIKNTETSLQLEKS